MLALVLFFMMTLTANASLPLWTITKAPESNPQQSVAKNGTVRVSYFIDNVSSKTKILTIQPTPGISQLTSCQLSAKGQVGSCCLLTLLITGSALPKGGLRGGPIVCQADTTGSSNANQCYQPNQADSLSIDIGQPIAFITVRGDPLLLFPAYPALAGISKRLTLTNTSSDMTATNLLATLPADWVDVTQDASYCISLAPGASCDLIFTPSTMSHEAIEASISGSNTNSVQTRFSVNYPWVITSGTISVILPDPVNHRIYLGGSFTSMGPNVGFGAPIDDTNAKPIAAYPRVNGAIAAVISDGVGGWYIGGDFTTIGGQSRNRAAAVDINTGLATPWNPNPNNAINGLALSGSTVYIAGNFINIGGQSRNYIAALDATSGLATSWNPNSNNNILVLALSDKVIYAGGNFSTISGELTNRFAILSE